MILVHLFLSLHFYEFVILKFMPSFVCTVFTIKIYFMLCTSKTVTLIHNVQRNREDGFSRFYPKAKKGPIIREI